jgi:putative peptidoglycan lipid II flippase
MSQMLKSSGAMGAATLTSRVLGMVREMAYARFMGDGPVAGAFTLAFTIPNLFRRLLGEGALTAAFIPIFKEKEKNASEAEMWRAANAVMSALLIFSAVVIALALAGLSLALATAQFDAKTRLMLELLRVMFPYMGLVCLAAVFMGVLNARGHFFIPALGAALLNVVMIASVFLVAPKFGAKLDEQIFALAFGVLVAGVAQAAFQLPSLRREGWRLAWVTPWGNDTVRAVVAKMGPGIIGVAAFQLNVTLVQLVSFWVDPVIVASFSYAVRLMELPQGVFGISLATYLLTSLSGLAAEKKFTEFRATLGQGLSYLVVINSLAAVLLLCLAEPIVRLLFERGEFGPESTQRAALALQCLAPGLLAFSMVNILARAFYALGDTQTPMKVSVFCLGANLLLSILLLEPLRQAGLGLANSITSCLNVWLLLRALRKKLGELELAEVKRSLKPVLAASIVVSILAWPGYQAWDTQFGHATLAARLGGVFVPAVLTSVLYWAVLWADKLRAAMEVAALIQKRLRRSRE